MYIIESITTNPYMNLAFENAVFDEFEFEEMVIEPTLFLWQNDNTIVIGMNQNPYKECDLGAVRKNDVKIARRTTGGGAVYHDVGNLNYSIFLPADKIDREMSLDFVVSALQSIGFNAQKNGRNDITVDGKKCSGNAFRKGKRVLLAHGTILLNVDLKKMQELLTPDKAKLKKNGVNSVASRVANLLELNPCITLLNIKNALKSFFIKDFLEKDCVVKNRISIEDEVINEKIALFKSNEWIYSDFSDNSDEINGLFSWGKVSVHIVLNSNFIEKCVIATDGLVCDIVKKMEQVIVGKCLEEILKDDIFEEVEIIEEDEIVVMNDILKLVRENIIE